MDRSTVPVVVHFSFFEKLLENFNWVRKFVQEEMNLGWVLWSDPIEPIQPKQRSPKFFYFLPVIYIYIYIIITITNVRFTKRTLVPLGSWPGSQRQNERRRRTAWRIEKKKKRSRNWVRVPNYCLICFD